MPDDLVGRVARLERVTLALIECLQATRHPEIAGALEILVDIMRDPDEATP